MKIAIGNDHGGLAYKIRLVEHLEKLGHEVINVGTDTLDSCHYPLFAFEVGELVASKKADLGVLICTSGQGVCMAANKVKGIRCGLAFNDEVSALMVEHNDANVIGFGAKFTTFDEAKERLDTFLTTEFAGGRHATRVQMIKDLEK